LPNITAAHCFAPIIGESAGGPPCTRPFPAVTAPAAPALGGY
jgi:hypothetical protein